jgi:hypothetical protein
LDVYVVERLVIPLVVVVGDEVSERRFRALIDSGVGALSAGWPWSRLTGCYRSSE